MGTGGSGALNLNEHSVLKVVRYELYLGQVVIDIRGLVREGASDSVCRHTVEDCRNIGGRCHGGCNPGTDAGKPLARQWRTLGLQVPRLDPGAGPVIQSLHERGGAAALARALPMCGRWYVQYMYRP